MQEELAQALQGIAAAREGDPEEWGAQGDQPFEATPEEMEQTLEGLMEVSEEGAMERAAGMAAGPEVLGTASPLLGEQAQTPELKGKDKVEEREPSPEMELLYATGPQPAAQGPTPSVSTLPTGTPTPLPPAHAPPSNPPDLRTTTRAVLYWKGLDEKQMADAFAQHQESHRPAAPPRVKALPGQDMAFRFLADSLPGLSASVDGGPRILRISKGHPMAGSNGVTSAAAGIFDSLCRNFPVGETIKTKHLYSSLTAASFQRIAAQIVQGPRPPGDFTTLGREVNRCIFQTEATAESLERNDFSWGFLSKHDNRGRNTTMMVGMLRTKEKATEFWESSDTIFESVGKAKAGTEASATIVGKASDTGTKAYHILPHFFEVDLVIELPPPLSGGRKHPKFYRFEIPQRTSVKLQDLRPGDPIFLLNSETDDLLGAWMVTAVDVPPNPDGSEATEELLSAFPDSDALSAYYAVDPAAPPPERGWTRWAYVRYMGSYEDRGWETLYIRADELRAIRYHVMEPKPGAPAKSEGKYTLRALRAHESPAGMFGTPGFYPIVAQPTPNISLYSEYFSMLARQLPPDPSALVQDGSQERFVRWFPDFVIPQGLQPLTHPLTPRAFQVWVLSAYDARSRFSDFARYSPGDPLPESPEQPGRLIRKAKREQTPGPSAGGTAAATAAAAGTAATPTPSKRRAEGLTAEEKKKSKRGTAQKGVGPSTAGPSTAGPSTVGPSTLQGLGPAGPQPPPPTTGRYVFALDQPRISQLVRILNAGGPLRLRDNVTNYLMMDLPRLINNPPLEDANLRKYMGFITQVGMLVPRFGVQPAPPLNLQLISAFSDLVAAAAAASADLASFFLTVQQELLLGNPIGRSIDVYRNRQDLPRDEETESEGEEQQRSGGPRVFWGVQRRGEQRQEGGGGGTGAQGGGQGQSGGPKQAQAPLGGKQRQLFSSPDFRTRGRSPTPSQGACSESPSQHGRRAYARSPSPRRARTTSSSSPDRSGSPSPSSGRARSVRSALREPAAEIAPPAAQAAANSPQVNGHVAPSPAPARAGRDPDNFFDYFTEEEVDFEPTPEPSPVPSAEVQADVSPPVEPSPSAGRRSVHQRLGAPVQNPERRPITERLTAPVQAERVPVTNRLGPVNQPILQGRLGAPNPPPPTEAEVPDPGDRLLALAAETEVREAIEVSRQLEGIPSPTLAVRSRVRDRSLPSEPSVRAKRSRFDQPPADSLATGAEFLYIAAQRRLQQLRLIETSWGSRCADPDNICLGRSQDLSWMEDIQAEIADAVEQVAAAKWKADFAKARELAQAKAAAVSSVSTVSLGAEFKPPKGKRPANRRGGKGKKGASRPFSGKKAVGRDGSQATPLKKSSTTTSVVTTAAVTSVRTVSRKTRWDV